jgi:hypothetical protein
VAPLRFNVASSSPSGHISAPRIKSRCIVGDCLAARLSIVRARSYLQTLAFIQPDAPVALHLPDDVTDPASGASNK